MRPITPIEPALSRPRAIEDVRKANRGFPYKVEIVQGDFQLKPDLAVAITKKWIDDGLNAIVDVPLTAAALAVSGQVKCTAVASLMNGAASNGFVTKHCSPNLVQWTDDQHSVGGQTVRAIIRRGGKNWLFVTQDSIGGIALEDGALPFVGVAHVPEERGIFSSLSIEEKRRLFSFRQIQ